MFSELCDEVTNTTGNIVNAEFTVSVVNEVIMALHYSGMYNKDRSFKYLNLEMNSSGTRFIRTPANVRSVLQVYNSRLDVFYNKVEIGKGMQTPENFYHYYETDGGYILSQGMVNDPITCYTINAPAPFEYYAVNARPAIKRNRTWQYLVNDEYKDKMDTADDELEARNKVASWVVERYYNTVYLGAYARFMLMSGTEMAGPARQAYIDGYREFVRQNKNEGYSDND